MVLMLILMGLIGPYHIEKCLIEYSMKSWKEDWELLLLLLLGCSCIIVVKLLCSFKVVDIPIRRSEPVGLCI